MSVATTASTWSLDRLARALHVTDAVPATPFRALCSDSRHAAEGAVFFAVDGTQQDGARFIDDAVQRGAVAVVAARPVVADVPVLHVSDVRRAKAEAARVLYGDPSRAMAGVGITGTNGKTTTATLIHEMFQAAGHVPLRLGTTGIAFDDQPLETSAHTTPDVLETVRRLAEARVRGGDSFVMEVSSHALEQARVEGVTFRVAVFTQLSREHLDYHGTVEAYQAAKARLFEGLERDATAVLNAEDAVSLQLVKRSPASILTYGSVPGASVRARVHEASLHGTVWTLETPRGARRLETSLVGRHNVMNALAAAAVGEALELDLDAVARALTQTRGVPGRLQHFDVGGVSVLIDYAHTDDALEKVLCTLRPLVSGRLITVFGCGGDRDRAKRPRMGRVASRWSDHVIVTSDNPRNEEPAAIAKDVEAGLLPRASWTVTLDRRDAIEEALGGAAAGDVVLVAGKGHETTQTIGGRVLPFDDAQVVEDWGCRTSR